MSQKPAVVRRATVRQLGIFLDGPALDRACKRLERRIDLKALTKFVSGGLTPALLRYYTLVPYEDDSRHRAFLNAVTGTGFDTIIKRLPPKNSNRQVSIDIEIASDIIAYSQNLKNLPKNDSGDTVLQTTGVQSNSGNQRDTATVEDQPSAAPLTGTPAIVVICPSRDLVHPLQILANNKVDVTVADFMSPGIPEILRFCRKWIDLSETEGIWM